MNGLFFVAASTVAGMLVTSNFTVTIRPRTLSTRDAALLGPPTNVAVVERSSVIGAYPDHLVQSTLNINRKVVWTDDTNGGPLRRTNAGVVEVGTLQRGGIETNFTLRVLFHGKVIIFPLERTAVQAVHLNTNWVAATP